MDNSQYFRELAICLTREGFTVQEEEDGLLPMELDGAPLCRVSKKGAIRFRTEEQDESREALIRGKVSDIVRAVPEYTKLMDSAPFLKATGLSDKFKLLADFNGTVLAAQDTKYGVQFVSWDWNESHTAVSNGNYYLQNYEGAKQDFAIRSGLIDEQRLFNDEQLIEIYRCCADTLDANFDLTCDQGKCIKSVQEQIQNGIPDIMDRIREQEQHTEMSYSQELIM